MPAQPPVILAAAEVLDIDLDRRMIHDLAEYAGAGERRLADLQAVRSLVKQNPAKLHPAARILFPEIDLDDIPFTYPVLSRTIFKNCVHESLRAESACEIGNLAS